MCEFILEGMFMLYMGIFIFLSVFMMLVKVFFIGGLNWKLNRVLIMRLYEFWIRCDFEGK